MYVYHICILLYFIYSAGLVTSCCVKPIHLALVKSMPPRGHSVWSNHWVLQLFKANLVDNVQLCIGHWLIRGTPEALLRAVPGKM